MRAAHNYIDAALDYLLVKQTTQLVNMVRALLAEVGINIPQGLRQTLELARTIVDGRRRLYRGRQ